MGFSIQGLGSILRFMVLMIEAKFETVPMRYRQTVCSSCLTSRANSAPCSQETDHQLIENPVYLLRTERNFGRSKFRLERSRSFGARQIRQLRLKIV
jgi:hypothetical protein